MQSGRISNTADIGFTDLLRSGGGVARGGHLSCSATGSSRVITIAPGSIWLPDMVGAETGIAGSLIRQVYAGGTTLLAANSESVGPRIDIVVAKVGGTWGSEPQISVKQGVATAGATIENAAGHGVLAAGEFPLCIIPVPVSSGNVAAFSGDGARQDLRVAAADLTPPGVVKSFDGAVPPLGYKWEDGTAYNRTVLAALFAAIATTQGVGDGSTTFNVGDARGRMDLAPDNMGPAGAAGRIAGASTISSTGGVETVLLTGSQSGIRSHSHGIGSGAAFLVTGAGRITQSGAEFPFGGSVTSTNNAGPNNAEEAHSNMSPYQSRLRIIKF